MLAGSAVNGLHAPRRVALTGGDPGRDAVGDVLQPLRRQGGTVLATPGVGGLREFEALFGVVCCDS
jgi:hypothetical protein